MGGEAGEAEAVFATKRIMSDLQRDIPKELRKLGLPTNIPDASVNSASDLADAVLRHWNNSYAAKGPDRLNFGRIMPRKDLIAAIEKHAVGRVQGGPLAGAEEAAVKAAGTKLAESKATLEPLGAGFARAVFKDADGSALKIAKKASGIAQNRSEAELSGRSSILNPVIAHAPDYSWVKQPLVKGFELGDEMKMAQHLGLATEDPNWLRKLAEGTFAEPLTPAAEEFQKGLQQVIREIPELDARDLAKAAQWGVDAEGELKLIDYGFQGADARKGTAVGQLDATAASAKPVSDKAVRASFEEMDRLWRVISAQEKKIKPIIGESEGLKPLANRLRTALQNEDTFGSAAKAHRELTTAVEREAAARDTLAAHFPSKGGKVDRQSVESFTKKLDRVTGEQRVQALADWVDTQNALANTARDHMDVSFAHNNQRLVKEYGDVFKRLREDVLSLNAQDRLLQVNRNQGIIPGLALGSGLAAMGLGPAGHAVGNMLGQTIMNPGRAARSLAALMQFKTQVAGHIEDRIGKIITGTGAVRKLPIQAPRFVGAMISGTDKERQEAYHDHLEEMQAVMEPTAYINHVTPQLATIADAAPDHATQIAQQGQKTLAYLANELPKPLSSLGPQKPFDFLNPGPPGDNEFTRATAGRKVDESNPDTKEEIRLAYQRRANAQPSPEDIRRYGRVAAVAVGGAPALLDAIERGNLNKAEVRAFKSLFPHQDADLQMQIIDMLRKGGNKVSKKTERSLMLYLGDAPDAAKTSFQQGIYAEEISEGAAAGAAPNLPTPNPRAPKLIGPLSTPTDAMANWPFPTQ